MAASVTELRKAALVDSDDAGSASEPVMSPSSSVPPKAADSASGDGDKLEIMAAACRTLLECIGEDPDREGLAKTPMRMAKALLAVTAGYSADAGALVNGALFASSNRQMVVVRDIDVYSMCEHHMLPFFGRVHVAYLPEGQVIGLSKLARLADVFAKRLQIQERLTQQIAEAVQEHVHARGVAVMVECTHMCMTMRGVEKPGSLTITTHYTGAFAEDRELVREFLSQVGGGSGSGSGRGR